MEQLICENLSLGYDGHKILENLNFTVSKGDYLCIIGENGAGKSTLMKSILGLIDPISGEIKLGKELLRKEFGYLTQQSEIQKDFPASVREIVLSGCQSKCGMRPFYNKKERELAKQAMEKMDILHLKNRCYRELSGGQQQRVLLARALCATEKIIFLDEPVSGLDQNVSADLYSVIEELNKKDNITIVMISHDIEASLKYATHVLHIGKNSFFGTKEEYLQSEISIFFNIEKGGQL
ncbi:MAG: ABC transporter ATP-binding protein [Eubacteriales bacterium]